MDTKWMNGKFVLPAAMAMSLGLIGCSKSSEDVTTDTAAATHEHADDAAAHTDDAAAQDTATDTATTQEAASDAATAAKGAATDAANSVKDTTGGP